MIDPTAEFPSVNNLRAEAMGEPGKRTFRVVADCDDGRVIIWLEKEQLLQLAVAVDQLLSNLSDEGSNTTTPRAGINAARGSFEFKAGKLVLSYDDDIGKVAIDAHDLEFGGEGPPTVRMWSGKSQARAFVDEALSECAAGRPICPLCGKSVDLSGHRCPRSNGHGLQEIGSL